MLSFRPSAVAFFLSIPLVACSSVDRDPNDTSTSSSAGGAGGAASSSSSASGEPLTVVHALTRDAHAPVAGAEVVANDADGHVVSTSVTDSTGKVALAVPNGGSLTLLCAAAGADGTIVRDAVTVLEAPRDGAVALPYCQDALGAPNAPMKELEIQVTGLPITTATWELSASCVDMILPASQTTVTIPDFAGCPGAPDYSAVVTAYDGSGYAVLGVGTLDPSTIEAGASVVRELHVFTNGLVPISATIAGLPESALHTSIEVRATNASQSHSQTAIEADSHGLSALAYVARVGVGFDRWRYVDSADVTASTGVRRAADVHSPFADFDLDGSQIAWIGAPVLDTTDITHPHIGWSVAEGPSADGSVATLAWKHADDVVTWTLLAPPGPGDFLFPDLPDDASAFVPVAPLAPAEAQQVDDLGNEGYAPWIADPERDADAVSSWGRSLGN